MKYRSPRHLAFTLLEMLVAMSIFAILMLVIFNVINQTAKAWKKSSDHIEAFQGSRAGFDLMTRNLAQATLNPYLDYYDASGQRRTAGNANFIPATYGRASELQFICGKKILDNQSPTTFTQVTHAVFFFAPLGSGTQTQGLNQTLNTCGYFVTFGDDSSDRPPFITTSAVAPRYRYRLMQWVRPANLGTIYTTGQGGSWVSSLATTATEVRPVADNVIALVIRPRQSEATEAALPAGTDPISKNYDYDSVVTWSGSQPQPTAMHQLPPIIGITMIILDETSAIRTFQAVATETAAANALGLDYTTLFQDPVNYDADIQSVKDALISRNLQFRVFHSTIQIRNAQ